MFVCCYSAALEYKVCFTPFAPNVFCCFLFYDIILNVWLRISSIFRKEAVQMSM